MLKVVLTWQANCLRLRFSIHLSQELYVMNIVVIKWGLMFNNLWFGKHCVAYQSSPLTICVYEYIMMQHFLTSVPPAV